MRRLAHHLFGLCSVVSLLLCVLVCVLWVRSYRRYDHLESSWCEPDRALVRWRSAWSASGRIWFTRLDQRMFGGGGGWTLTGHNYPPAEWGGAWRHESGDAEPDLGSGDPGLREWRGFQYRSVRGEPLVGSPFVCDYDRGGMPHWAGAAASAVLPALAAVGLARRRRASQAARRGLCPNCGYDLRATPGRCPECGAQAGAGA